MSESFCEALKNVSNYYWAIHQVSPGIYETHMVKEGPRTYEEYTDRALRLQKEVKRLIETRK